MGTPAFPNLGKHCSVEDCRLIDFLPFTCDCCHKVFCLEHRSYNRHDCPTANKNNVTVVICPLCVKGVRLIPDEDPNITWGSHVNTECDPSNYEKATKKKKCPVPRCRELLTFSNTIKCRDCTVDHCLKHRFGPDHSCPGPKKPEAAFPFMNFLNGNKEEPKKAQSTSSSRWTTSLFKVVSSVKEKLSSEFSQTQQTGQSGRITSHSANTSSQVEQCPQCHLRFSTVKALIDHVQKIHEKNGVMNLAVDVCPRCSKGFRDPVALVEHVEREEEKDIDKLITRLVPREEAPIALMELMKWRLEGLDPLYAQAVQVKQRDPVTGRMKIANPQSSRLVWETCLKEFKSLGKVAVRLLFLQATSCRFKCNWSFMRWVSLQGNSRVGMDRAQRMIFIAAHAKLEKRDFSSDEEKDAEMLTTANGEDDMFNEVFVDAPSV